MELVYKNCLLRQTDDHNVKLVSVAADCLPPELVYEYKLGQIARFSQPFFVWGDLMTAKTSAYHHCAWGARHVVVVISGPPIGKVIELGRVPIPYLWTLTPERSAEFWEAVKSGQAYRAQDVMNISGDCLAVEAMLLHRIEAVFSNGERLYGEAEERLKRALWRAAMTELEVSG